MFQRTQQEQYQRLMADTRTDTMLRLLEPLNNYWPDLVILLRKNIQDGVSPFRLGEIIAKEFQTMMDTLGREHQRKFDKQYRTAYDLEKELSSKIEQFTKEKQKYLFTIQTLDEKNQEQARQIRIQNSLLADLHRQISNLTGAEDSSSTT
jgi:hypothetical protein